MTTNRRASYWSKQKSRWGKHAVWPRLEALEDRVVPAIEYSATLLGDLPGGANLSRPFEINNHDQIVGESESGEGTRAFLWLPEDAYGLPAGMNDLGIAGQPDVYAINELGQVVWNGGANIGSESPHFWDNGVLWENGQFTDLGNGGAFDLNDNGQIVGAIESPAHAALWASPNASAIEDIGGVLPRTDHERAYAYQINNLGQVVGQSFFPAARQAYLINPEDTNADGMPDQWFRDDNGNGYNDLIIDLGVVPEGESAAFDINDQGQVVGLSSEGAWLITPEDTSGDGRPDQWHRDAEGDGTNDLLEFLGVPRGSSYAINSHGQIVGTVDPLGSQKHGFVWDSVNGARNLNDLVDLPAGWRIQTTFDINDKGHIVAEVVKSNGEIDAVLLRPGSVPTLPGLSIVDVALPEGDIGMSDFTFTVSLSAASASTVTVDFRTEDRTATVLDDDYLSLQDTLTFAPGETQKTFVVNVLGDAKSEPDETFTVHLSNAVNADIRRSVAVGTIQNDDSPTLSINDVSAAEGNNGATAFTFTVTLSAASPETVTVDYATTDGTATAGEDYVAQSGKLSFAPGVTSQTISVPVNGDVEVEPDETFSVELSNPVNGTITKGAGLGTIENDDTLQFDISLNFLDDNLTPTQRTVFTQAKERWEEIIVADLPDVHVPGIGLVDDIFIEVIGLDIDGPGGILGAAGPYEDALRDSTFLPAAGFMAFDTADLALLEAAGQLDELILHEMAHSMGFGVIWHLQGLLDGEGTADPRFIGTQAVREYQEIFNTTETSVPVENTGGVGTQDAHWRESVFGNELMTGFLNGGVANPLSRITVGAFADMGYEVNFDAADSYQPPSEASNSIKAFYALLLNRPSDTSLGTILNDNIPPPPPPPPPPTQPPPSTPTATSLSPTITVIGADAGGGPRVQVFNADGSLRFDFFAYSPAFTGGVHVAVGDVNGDGMQDIITGTGAGGGPHVRVFDGETRQVMRDFYAYSPLFTGGITVAAADVNGDGFDDIITGAGPSGGPHVQVFSGRDGSNLHSFFAYDPSFTFGINVAAGDVDGDGFADIITAPQAGGGPHVRVFSGGTGAELATFFAYDPSFIGGVYIAAGDINGDGFADVVTGAGASGGPHVRVFSGEDLAHGATNTIRDFFAYAPSFLPGVRVATADRNGDGRADILTGAGPGGGPHVKLFDGATNNELDSFFAFEPNFTGGLFVGGNDGAFEK